LRLPA